MKPKTANIMSCCNSIPPPIRCQDIPRLDDHIRNANGWFKSRTVLRCLIELRDLMKANEYGVAIARFPFMVQYKKGFVFDLAIRIGDYDIIINSQTGAMWAEHHSIVHDLFIVQANRR